MNMTSGLPIGLPGNVSGTPSDGSAHPDPGRSPSRCAWLVPTVVLLAMPALTHAQDRDAFHFLTSMNKAAAVMLVEEGVIPPDLGGTIADAVRQVTEDQSQPGAERSGNYLDYEALLIDVGGPDVSRIHSGRSRQDIGATSRRMFQRDSFLAAFEELNETRAFLLDLAAQHPNAVMPAYTWGVQAQPTTFGHYCLAFNEAFERDAERMKDAWPRLNASPLGSAVIGTSSFPVNRPRLAELLGFDGVVENSYGAVQISPVDVGAELASIGSSAALTTGTLVADITAQYHQASPWFIMSADAVGGSSIMPQKRNPTLLVNLRAEASRLVGDATQFTFLAHNVEPGMGDYKGSEPDMILRGLGSLLVDLRGTLSEFQFNEDRALQEVADEYSTTTELADVLQRDADVPFRVGHHFASELVTFGRANGLAPYEIPFGEAQRLFTEAAESFDLATTEFPLTEQQLHDSLSPTNMVAVALGLGGTQPAEIERMLARQRAQIEADRAWVEDQHANLDAADGALDEAFQALMTQ